MRRAPIVAIALLMVLPASVSAKRDSEHWATINVCDTARQPDALGIRASMPGTPRGARVSMRFRVQYRDADGDWVYVEDADSGWRRVGIARGGPVESGWSFKFARMSGEVVMRGVVRFRWRRGDSLPRRAELATEGGHRSSAGADPAGYSAATCTLGS
jgi:hypothetical protein